MMPILAAIAAIIASFFVAMLIVGKVSDAFRDRLTRKRIDSISAIFCFPLVGSSAYSLAAFDGGISFAMAAVINLVVGCLFVAFVSQGVWSFIEAFVAAIIFCLTMSVVVPAI